MICSIYFERRLKEYVNGDKLVEMVNSESNPWLKVVKKKDPKWKMKLDTLIKRKLKNSKN